MLVEKAAKAQPPALTPVDSRLSHFLLLSVSQKSQYNVIMGMIFREGGRPNVPERLLIIAVLFGVHSRKELLLFDGMSK